ncbi:hypothetical protein EIJ81_01415 (plasmid) [Aliivibrio salmonicida]|uniref:hypothetical protein n=1 Tax=Aliivibrio salmonicida TaxID=40269 RepID=UPI000F6F1EAE|nr:hypothetical protein [Aliivibrio salmonicida]AZL83549.1 hypothetical protein EIJ81_01415 [Aliivibrio salmonicida]
MKAVDFALALAFDIVLRWGNNDRNLLAVRNSVSLRIKVIGGRATRGNDPFSTEKNALNKKYKHDN